MEIFFTDHLKGTSSGAGGGAARGAFVLGRMPGEVAPTRETPPPALLGWRDPGAVFLTADGWPARLPEEGVPLRAPEPGLGRTALTEERLRWLPLLLLPPP
ncbi:MAG TPA: hypothetical protein VF664_15830, partial [Cystobacter sp.]